VVMPGGERSSSSSAPAVGGGGSETSRSGATITSLAGARAHGHVEGSSALKAERAPSPTEALENLPWSPGKTESRPDPKAIAAGKRAEAKAQGFEGEACGECGNFTLVRNGTCLKCNTCGGTTGCS
jgi:ribonucleoside-diphosphate reductase alpha chain